MDTYRTNLRNLLEHTLRNNLITVLFQPVIHLGRQRVTGFEASIRGQEGTMLHPMAALLDTAEQFGRLADLEILAAHQILQRFVELDLSGLIFVVLRSSASALTRTRIGDLQYRVQQQGIETHRVVISLAGHLPRDEIEPFREAGFKVALDDVCRHQSSLRILAETCPDFIRINRLVAEGSLTSPGAKRYLASLVEIAKITESQLVCKGMETAEQYALLRNMGVGFGQGDYFAPLKAVPETQIDPQRFSERTRRIPRNDSPSIGKLIRDMVTVEATTPVREVERLFHENPDLISIAIVRDGVYPLGMVLRTDLLNILVQRYGRELFARKSIETFIKRPSLIFDENTPQEEVSRTLTHSVEHYIDEFILTRQGQVAGRGLLLDLLRSITDMQVARARYANPLTLLPGNVIIQQKLDEFIAAEEPFTVAYCDLDNFKPYNDVYGYHKGDEIIRLMGRLLLETCETGENFVGHIGGDDFIVLFKTGDWLTRCEHLFQKIREIVPNHYSEEDRTRGSIVARDRFGQTRVFPLVSLSIGGILIDRQYELVDMERISELATRAKKTAKETTGNSIHVIPCCLDHSHALPS